MSVLAARFAELGVATTYEAAGREGLVAGAFVRVVPGARVAGPARTAACGANDNLAAHRVLDTVEPGEVVVLVAPEPWSAALVGELLALQARTRGAVALLVDGAVRDVDELVALGLPVWARTVCAAGAAKDERGELQVPVTVGDVLIGPGDLVVLDGDGAVVVPWARSADVLAATEARHAYELDLRERLATGESTLDVMGLRPT
ncbi:dimethylmenaquinone methyltransferase [Gaiella sp.]|uniref:RraA family protein n=1 Tax=Gaiella sp. TaxID=2663207 RepID=UPI00326465B5